MYSIVIYILHHVQGPVPTLFSEDPISTMENMKKEPAKLHWDLSKLYKVSRIYILLLKVIYSSSEMVYMYSY
jgi:hypothetical protein